MLDLAEARILSRAAPLMEAKWCPFKEVALEPGAARTKAHFVLVPLMAPDERVEVAWARC